jgi:hypothetical protein
MIVVRQLELQVDSPLRPARRQEEVEAVAPGRPVVERAAAGRDRPSTGASGLPGRGEPSRVP